MLNVVRFFYKGSSRLKSLLLFNLTAINSFVSVCENIFTLSVFRIEISISTDVKFYII
jgi:hypothetical protein